MHDYIDDCPCPVLYTLHRINGKWKLLILWQLVKHGPMRFNALRREIGDISHVMLSQSLQALQSDGIVKRVQYDEMPLRVEYFLTELGHEMVPVFQAMACWGKTAKKAERQANAAMPPI